MTQHLHAWMLAANGEWEKALTVDATVPLDSAAILGWVMQQPQNVAFEAEFAESPGEPNTMFGIRLTALPKAEQAARIAAFISRTPQIKTEADFLREYQTVFPEFPLFGRAPDALNIGVVGAWFSVGEHAVWKPGSTSLSAAQLQQTAPRFFETRQNPTAIEAWYTTPMDHWYKIYVSAPSAGPNGRDYTFSQTRYDSAIRRFNESFLCL